MEKIFQVYIPQYYRDYDKAALATIIAHLYKMKENGAKGVWLIGLWDSDWSDIGFSIREYTVNKNFGTIHDLNALIKAAHALDLEVGCDIVPNHVSFEHDLARKTNGDTIYIVDESKAKELKSKGVPSFFGKKPYSYIKTNKHGTVLARTKFTDGKQVDVNWENPIVRCYFRQVFQYIKRLKFDFVRVDCAELLLEDVQKADIENPMACTNPIESIEAIIKVSDGMKLFLECFDPEIIQYNFGENVYICDCSFVMDDKPKSWSEFKRQTFKYASFANYVPVLGGHDQMPFANRFGFKFNDTEFYETKNKYLFTDLATELGFKNEARIWSKDDIKYDSNLRNPNKRWMSRCPIKQIL